MPNEKRKNATALSKRLNFITFSGKNIYLLSPEVKMYELQNPQVSNIFSSARPRKTTKPKVHFIIKNIFDRK